MNRVVIAVCICVLTSAGIAGADLLDKLKDLRGKKDADKQTSPGQTAAPAGAAKDEHTVVAGLKEALTIGSQKAVETVAKENGYFGNPKIKIPLPEKVQKVEGTLRKVGLKKQMDEFHLAMNRAAEKAAPQAKDIFIGAVKAMSITDGLRILQGGDTAATEYFRSQTSEKLYTTFKPIVGKAVMEVGVTKAYQNLVDAAKSKKIVKDASLDLDHHVTTKALDGLFYMVGEEEKKIRKDPVARVTDLLKQVFGR